MVISIKNVLLICLPSLLVFYEDHNMETKNGGKKSSKVASG